MSSFFDSFWDAMIIVPFFIVLFFILMYLIKIYFEFRMININLKAYVSINQELIELMEQKEEKNV